MTQGPETFVGEVGVLSLNGRLVIPAEVRKALTFLNGKDPVSLFTDIALPGVVRIYPAEMISRRLEGLRARLSGDQSLYVDLLAAAADRYREIRYYPSDTRLHLTPAIIVTLESGTAGDQRLYVEARGNHLALMSLSARNLRLEQTRADLELLSEEGD